MVIRRIFYFSLVLAIEARTGFCTYNFNANSWLTLFCIEKISKGWCYGIYCFILSGTVPYCMVLFSTVVLPTTSALAALARYLYKPTALPVFLFFFLSLALYLC